jgi:hypothetical protein
MPPIRLPGLRARMQNLAMMTAPVLGERLRLSDEVVDRIGESVAAAAKSTYRVGDRGSARHVSKCRSKIRCNDHVAVW